MTAQPALDRYQQRHSWLGLPIAILYKFTDDQGAYLAALITYYGFLSLFPLLLLLTSILGFVLHGDPTLQHRIIGSAASDFPIIGKQLTTNVRGYHGSGIGLAVGILGSLYGGLGVAQAGQNAMNSVWAVPKNSRPNPFKSRLRSLGILACVGIGLAITTVLSGATTGAGSFMSSAHLGALTRAVSLAISLIVNVAVFLVAFRLLTHADVASRDLRVGAVTAAVGWQVLQVFGTYLLAHTLKGATEVYGLFGIVLGLIAWIHLESLLVVFCAELNVVVRRELHPRSLLTPFTDNVTLTDADERAYTSYAQAQRNKGFETIKVSFRRGRRSRR